MADKIVLSDEQIDDIISKAEESVSRFRRVTQVIRQKYPDGNKMNYKLEELLRLAADAEQIIVSGISSDVVFRKKASQGIKQTHEGSYLDLPSFYAFKDRAERFDALLKQCINQGLISKDELEAELLEPVDFSDIKEALIARNEYPEVTEEQYAQIYGRANGETKPTFADLRRIITDNRGNSRFV